MPSITRANERALRLQDVREMARCIMEAGGDPLGRLADLVAHLLAPREAARAGVAGDLIKRFEAFVTRRDPFDDNLGDLRRCVERMSGARPSMVEPESLTRLKVQRRLSAAGKPAQGLIRIHAAGCGSGAKLLAAVRELSRTGLLGRASLTGADADALNARICAAQVLLAVTVVGVEPAHVGIAVDDDGLVKEVVLLCTRDDISLSERARLPYAAIALSTASANDSSAIARAGQRTAQ